VVTKALGKNKESKKRLRRNDTMGKEEKKECLGEKDRPGEGLQTLTNRTHHPPPKSHPGFEGGKEEMGGKKKLPSKKKEPERQTGSKPIKKNFMGKKGSDKHLMARKT